MYFKRSKAKLFEELVEFVLLDEFPQGPCVQVAGFILTVRGPKHEET